MLYNTVNQIRLFLEFCAGLRPIVRKNNPHFGVFFYSLAVLLTQVALARDSAILVPTKIDAVEWVGVLRTQLFVMERELPWKVGELVTPEAFKLGVDRLGNLPMVTQVVATVVMRDGKNTAVFEIEERWTIKPIFSITATNNNLWFVVGVGERSLLGRYLEVELFYEYFNGVHGGRFAVQDPRFLNTTSTVRVLFERLMRPRPDFLDQKTRVRLSGFRLIHQDQFYFGGSFEVFQDNFYPPLVPVGAPLPTGILGSFIEPTLRIGRINRIRLLSEGRTLEVKPQFGFTAEVNPAVYAQFITEGISFWRFGDRLNIASRFKLGITTPVPTPIQFYSGGLDNMRGFPDNSFQAEQFGLYNVDIRLLVFEYRYVACLPYLFSDGIISNSASQGFRMGVSGGIGLFFTIPAIVDSELRFEFAIPSRNPASPTFGVSTTLSYR